MTAKLSVLIPSRNEPYLTKTVDDILSKSRGPIEVIVCLDGGDWPENWVETSERHGAKLKTIHRGESRGMRSSINAAVDTCDGSFLFKADAHIAVSKGFDEILKRDCPPNAIMIPRRYRLEPRAWKRIRDGRAPVDYEYMSAPDGNGGGLKGKVWDQRAIDRKDIQIDPTWLFQGSSWFMSKDYFRHLDLMDEENYGTFWKESIELSHKAWLSGGQVLTHKGVFVAHWHKDRRGYSMPSAEEKKAQAYCMKWLDDSTGWPKQTLPFSSLLERFNPPTWEDWKPNV